MKKAISILALVVLLVSMTTVTAFARCGGRGWGTTEARQPLYEACAVDDCELAGMHQHDGVWYCDQNGWQGNYDVCTVDGCEIPGMHEHNGTYYHGANGGNWGGCGRGITR